MHPFATFDRSLSDRIDFLEESFAVGLVGFAGFAGLVGFAGFAGCWLSLGSHCLKPMVGGIAIRFDRIGTNIAKTQVFLNLLGGSFVGPTL